MVVFLHYQFLVAVANLYTVYSLLEMSTLFFSGSSDIAWSLIGWTTEKSIERGCMYLYFLSAFYHMAKQHSKEVSAQATDVVHYLDEDQQL